MRRDWMVVEVSGFLYRTTQIYFAPKITAQFNITVKKYQPQPASFPVSVRGHIDTIHRTAILWNIEDA